MTPSAASRQPDWKPALTATVLIFGWIAYWYGGTLAAMAQIWWRSDTYAHGLVVPPIALWLIWRERHRLSSFQAMPTLWLAVPLGCFVFLWLLGDLTAVNALTQFSVIGIVVLTTMSLLGLSVSKELAFPLLFLFFAVPIGDFLLPVLMEWTADFTVLALRLTGIPVFREGQNFVIPTGNWSVVEACSGIRYLIASLTVGTLYAYLTYTSLKRRLIFIVVALLVPIVANWLRAYLIVILGHISGNKIAAGADHLIYGWVFFGIVIAIMFAIGMRWAETSRPDQAGKPLPASGSPSAKSHWPVVFMVALIVAAGPLYENRLQQGKPSSAVSLAPVAVNNAWQATGAPIDWRPKFANPSAELQSAYRNGEDWVGLYVAYYRDQDQERKLVTSTNVLVHSNDPVWQIVASGSASARFGDTEQAVREAVLLNKQSNADARYIVWQWYWVNGQLTTSDIKAKWLTAWSVLTNQGDDSAVIILYTPKEAAARTLPAFSDAMGKAILDNLARTRKQ